MATFEDLDLLRDLHLSEEDVAFLQSKGYDSDRLRRIAGLLENKWAGVPRGLFLDDQIPAFGEVFHRGMKLVPSIPRDISIDWFLERRRDIPHGSGAAAKHGQHLKITRAIFYWRLDRNHGFQRFHDPTRYNTAVFLSLLAKDMENRAAPPYDDTAISLFKLSDAAKEYMICYLRAVIEHHNDPANFVHRDHFIAQWKEHRFDIYTFHSHMGTRVRNANTRLNNRWHQELVSSRNSMPLAEYNQRIGRFVGVILPGEAEFRIHRDTKGVEFGAATKLFEDTPAPSADDFGNIMHSLEAPYNGPAAKPAPEHTWHVANINIAADIFESVQPAEILHFLDAEFSRVEH